MTAAELKIDVENCPRCGGGHTQLRFQGLARYVERGRHPDWSGSIVSRPQSPEIWFIGVCPKSSLILRAHVTIEAIGVLNAERSCAENTLEIEQQFGQWTKAPVEVDPAAPACRAPNSPLESAVFIAS